jgi:hypothetical protein
VPTTLTCSHFNFLFKESDRAINIPKKCRKRAIGDVYVIVAKVTGISLTFILVPKVLSVKSVKFIAIQAIIFSQEPLCLILRDVVHDTVHCSVVPSNFYQNFVVGLFLSKSRLSRRGARKVKKKRLTKLRDR